MCAITGSRERGEEVKELKSRDKGWEGGREKRGRGTKE